MTLPPPPSNTARQPGLPRFALIAVVVFVVLGLVGEALIFGNYLQVTRNVRPGFARATRLLPLLSSLQTSVLELHAATLPLLEADIPDFRAVEVLRPEVEARANALRQEAGADEDYAPALEAVDTLLTVWDGQMDVLRSNPDIPTAAVMRFEVQRALEGAETALADLYALEEQDFYTSTDSAFVALGNIQGVLLGLGVLLAATGAALFVVLRRTARSEVERAYDRLQAAAEVGLAATSTLDVDRLLAQVVNLIRDRFGFYHVSIFLLDERGERAVLREATGEAGQRLKAAGHALAVGSQSIIGWVTENRRTRIAGEVGADPVHFKNELLPETRAELAVPLVASDRLLGALDVQSRQANAFTEADARVLQGLADQIAVAITNASEYGTQQLRSQKLAALSEAALRLAETHNSLLDLLDLATRRAMEVVNADGAALWLPAADGEMELKVSYRGQTRQIAGRRLSTSEGVVGRVLDRGQVAQAEGAADGLPGRGDAVTNSLLVPLAWQGGVTGLLVLTRFRTGARFNEEDQNVARLFASQTAAAIENFRLIAETRERVAELSSLNQISTALTRETPADLGRALRAAAEQMQSLLGMDHVRLVLLDAEAAAGETVAEYPDWGMVGLRLPLEDYPLLRQMIETRAPLWVSEVAADTRMAAAARDYLLAHNVRALLLVPLLARETVMGFAALEAASDRPALDETEVNLCLTIAAQVAIAAQNAGLFDQNSRQARRERLINQITDRIRRAVDVPGVLQATATELGQALGARRARIAIKLQPPEAQPAPEAGGQNGSANGHSRAQAGNSREAAQ